MKNIGRLSIQKIFLMFFALFSASAFAQIREQAFRFAVANPPGHPIMQGGTRFSELVSEKSNGKMIVKLYSGGVLGGDVDVLTSVVNGTIDITSMNAGILQSIIKEFAVLDFPFLFNNADEAYALMDGPIGKRLEQKMAEKGLTHLAYYELGFRHMTNSRHPVKTVEDIRGLKIRVIESPTYIDTFNALGAKATPMPITEVYSALDKYKVDGQENPLSVIASNRFDAVQKYLTISRHAFNTQSLFISKKVWDKLTNDERKILQESAKQTAIFERKAAERAESRALARLKETMQVYELNAAELAGFREKLKPVIAKYSQQIGADFIKQVMTEVEKNRR